MSRRMPLKRKLDLCDSSPESSTPPRGPFNKRAHVAPPSDSPSNPFGLYRAAPPPPLPRATPTSEHLLLRFQLADGARSVFRIVQVPSNYTFWHLAHLVGFLFAWRDARSLGAKNRRRTQERRHIFEVQKEVSMYGATTRAGMVKSGRVWAVLTGQGATVRGYPECSRAYEESFTLQNAWPRGPDATRAIVYVHDLRERLEKTVYITVHTGEMKTPRRRGASNAPLVLLGRGLADDDEDDDDFALDLEQWNAPRAFAAFIGCEEAGRESLGLEDDDQEWSPEERSQRIEEAHARLKQIASDGLSQFDSDEDKNAEGEVHDQIDELEEDRRKEEELEAMERRAKANRAKTASRSRKLDVVVPKLEQEDLFEDDPFGDEAEL